MCHAPCICSCCNRLIRQPIRLPEYNFDQDDDNQELHHSIDLWPTILQRRCTDHYLDNVNSNHPEDELDDYSRREDIPSANNLSLHAKNKKKKKKLLFFLSLKLDPSFIFLPDPRSSGTDKSIAVRNQKSHPIFLGVDIAVTCSNGTADNTIRNWDDERSFDSGEDQIWLSIQSRQKMMMRKQK